MKKRIGYKLEDNDLDKVSGGRMPSGFGEDRGGWFKCQRCGTRMCELNDIRDGDKCPDCGYIQQLGDHST